MVLYFLFSLLCPISRRRQWPSIKRRHGAMAGICCSCRGKKKRKKVAAVMSVTWATLAHYHRTTFKHLSRNQIRESVTDLDTEPRKPWGHVGFRRKPYLSRLLPVSLPHTPPSNLSLLDSRTPRAHTRLFTLGECVQAEPLSPDSLATLRRSVTGSHTLPHTSPEYPRPA